MVLPVSILKEYKAECYFYSSTVSKIDQKILNVLMKNRYFERHLNKMRKIYKNKHDVLLESLEPFKKNFVITGENAGLHLLLTSKNKEEKELIWNAKKFGVKVYGLSDSDIKNKIDKECNTVIIGFASLQKEEIEKGIELLKKAWNIE